MKQQVIKKFVIDLHCRQYLINFYAKNLRHGQNVSLKNSIGRFFVYVIGNGKA